MQRVLSSPYLAMLYVGCLAGTFAGVAAAGAEGLDGGRFALAVIVLLVPALAGSRLWFLAQHRGAVAGGRWWRREDGGMALHGGLVLAVAASVLVLRLADLPFWGFWDAASITMLVGLVLTRFGCLRQGCCAGRPTEGRFGVRLRDAHGVLVRRWPSQLLEAGWGAAILVVALIVRDDAGPSGVLFGGVVAAYAAGRLLLEPTRDAARSRRVLRLNSGASAALVAAALTLLVLRAA